MKKSLLILGLAFVFLSSCKKSDDSPTYTQDMLNGSWENIVKDDEGCTDILQISPTSLKQTTVCPSSTATITYESYSFDGKVMHAQLIGIKFDIIINELTDTKLVITVTATGMSEKYEYKRK